MAAVLVVAVAACGGSEPDAATAGSGGGEAPAADGGQPDEGGETTSPPVLRQFSIAAAGDILVHTPVMASAQANSGTGGYDFGPMFDEVRDVISAADLAICHQETPISADNTALSGYPVFNAPREIAPALAEAGFDACEATSNHSLDRGFAGVTATLDAFDQAGIQHTGTARTAEEQANPPIYDVNGVEVGHLAYTYGYNGIPVPAEAPWLGDLVYPEVGFYKVLADVGALRERGAEFVVISMQWGSEYQQEPTTEQMQWARGLLLRPEVDLILGDHVHVIQPCEKINGKYVHYGMGNFLSNQSPAAGLLASTQDGAVVTYEIEEISPGEFETTSMSYAPTFVNIPGHQIQLATPDRHPESHQRTVAAMSALGPGACDAVPAS
jgi:poly-gamma-glutamate synthesis protein (capsule biosynthesis protein)